MLDIKFLRENPDVVKQNIKNKFQDSKLPLVDEVIDLDAQARATQQEADDLRANRNKLSKQIGALMAQGKKEEAEEVKEETAEEKAEETVDSKDEKIKDLESQINKWKTDYYKVFADMENLKKRLKTEHANQLKYAMQSFIEELLPVIDNYERSLTVEPESEEGKNILKGNKMILNQLMNILGKNGVTVIEAQGKEFDPNIHQAVMQDDNPDFGPNIVTEELQKGYMLKDRVIRATLVKVNKD